METRLSDSMRATAIGQEADRILRACVHCGFCTATCPTYQLLGDELDGPRGRIYLIKNLLEGEQPTRQTQVHLDRCLTCLNCEITCPSGVEYRKLLDIGRNRLEAEQRRPLSERLLRWGLRHILPYPQRLWPMFRLGMQLRPVLPASLREKLPLRESQPQCADVSITNHAARPGRSANVWTSPRTRRRPAIQPAKRPTTRKVIVLDNCVEPLLAPATVEATERILATLGIAALRPRGAGCCGAIAAHLSAPEQARAQMRRNLDAWQPAIDAGAEAILITASGCGAMVKDYGWHLRDDPDYGERAARAAGLARDPSELLGTEDAAKLAPQGPRRIAFHPPCSLQHGQKLAGRVENLLRSAGFELLPVADSHRCCGSAGTYSLLQSKLATELRDQKLSALQAQQPELIATANVGCQSHLQAAADTPVIHWLELLATDALNT